MKKSSMEHKILRVDELTILAKNPRTITEVELEKLKKSLEADPKFLHHRPILVNKVNGKYVVYGGSQRLTAARALGWESVDCIVEENLSQSVMDYRMLADNTHQGEWSFEGIPADTFSKELLSEVGQMQKDIKDFSKGNNIEVGNLTPKEGGEGEAKPKGTNTMLITLKYETSEQWNKIMKLLEYLRIKYPQSGTMEQKFLVFLTDWNNETV